MVSLEQPVLAAMPAVEPVALKLAEAAGLRPAPTAPTALLPAPLVPPLGAQVNRAEALD